MQLIVLMENDTPISIHFSQHAANSYREQYAEKLGLKNVSGTLWQGGAGDQHHLLTVPVNVGEPCQGTNGLLIDGIFHATEPDDQRTGTRCLQVLVPELS